MRTLRRNILRIAVTTALAAGLASPPPAAAEPLLDLTWPAGSLVTIAGSDRVATAIEVSRSGWPGGAGAAVLVSGDDYPDALAAAALSGATGGPLLLTPAARLDGRVTTELQRLGPEVIYVVGGPAAVAPEVEAALGEAGFETERVAGETRYATAFAVASRAVELGGDASTVIVTSGVGFADALSASGLAAGLGYPILLVAPETPAAQVAEWVDSLGAGRVLVVGGTASVPPEPVASLDGHERIAGSDRIGTALAVAGVARGAGLAGPPVVASGGAFADGLSGGVLAGVVRRGPLLLTGRQELPRPVMEWLATERPASAVQLGGPVAIAPLAACQLGAGQARPWPCIESELHRQGYHVGAVDGRIDRQSPWAVYAFQKVAQLPVNGQFREPEWRALIERPTVAARRPDLGPDHLEVDLTRQLLLMYRGGELAHAFHVSTGKPSTPTIRGTYTIYRKLDYRNVSNMYKPVYFYPRYAIHGYPSVPLHPASAGCVRIDDRDQDFLWPKVPIGEQIAIYY